MSQSVGPIQSEKIRSKIVRLIESVGTQWFKIIQHLHYILYKSQFLWKIQIY